MNRTEGKHDFAIIRSFDRFVQKYVKVANIFISTIYYSSLSYFVALRHLILFLLFRMVYWRVISGELANIKVFDRLKDMYRCA
jgi:hypothetical protein